MADYRDLAPPERPYKPRLRPSGVVVVKLRRRFLGPVRGSNEGQKGGCAK